MTYFLVVYVHKGQLFEDAFENRNEAEKFAELKKGYLINAFWMKNYNR